MPASLTRGRWPLTAAAVSIAIAALGLGGCASLGTVVDEPLRVGNVDDVAPERMSLEEGKSSLEEGFAAFATRGMTGVVSDAHRIGDAGTLTVIGADYQSRVEVFRNEVFLGAISLPTHGLPPYGLALRIAYEHGRAEVLVLYRDALDRDNSPPTLMLFSADAAALSAPAFHLEARASLTNLIERHNGLTLPKFVGDGFEEGILLVARDRQGELWDTGYFLRVHDGEIALEGHPIEEALRCPCVQKYADGILDDAHSKRSHSGDDSGDLEDRARDEVPADP